MQDPRPESHGDEPDPRIAEVTDYLVAVRGGAPFLSGADGRLLLVWLDAGVPVPAILAAIDTVAARRRKKRARSRLTLAACRRTVEKVAAKAQPSGAGEGPVVAGSETSLEGSEDPSTRSPGPRKPVAGPLAPFLAELDRAEVPAELLPAFERLRAELGALARTATLHPDALGRAAARCLTAFHQAAWEAAADRHDALRARAAAQLEPVRQAMPEAKFYELVEEVARDLLRQELPAVSARRLWDSLGT
ncbi:MAG: hypothetical protein D6798_03465 [Deltaproteobacteria bacterium]|nr:MAG: hypothetical protein D6798_03465 [Deltaproteobacteria bacterium]